MKIAFRKVKLSPANKERLDQINAIIEEYQSDGYVLTLRQLYYQLVSRDIISNKQSEYAKLSTLLKEGRMGGIVDWDAIEDRLRKPDKPSEFASPREILQAAHDQYRLPRMKGQSKYIEVWVEKDALSGVLKRITEQYGISILVNRGYSSCSSMFDSYERFKEAIELEQSVDILYLGDYDPSGIDMIRDIKERSREFLLSYWLDEVEEIDEDDELDADERVLNFKAWFDKKFSINPIALTRAQINQYNPPPNPAKRTDPRAKKFIKAHGSTSWEVDALRPEVLNAILTREIESRLDMKLYKNVMKEEKTDKAQIQAVINDNF